MNLVLVCDQYDGVSELARVCDVCWELESMEAMSVGCGLFWEL